MIRTIETDNIIIEYATANDSFSHAFGIHNVQGYKIMDVQVYIPAFDEWMDASCLDKFSDQVNSLIEKDIEASKA